MPSTTTATVADVILAQLALWGIQNMYGTAGDAIIPLLDAIQHQDAIRYIPVRHEFAAAVMASTEGKCTSRIGACIGTSGPGLANMLNGIADACADHVPMLVITGQVTSDKVGTEAKQAVDQQRLIEPLTVFSAPIIHPDAAVTLTNQAIIEAISKQGVSHLSIPKDVLALPCPLAARPPTGLLQHTRPANLSQLDRCVQAVLSAQKPMIYIGLGARGASAPIMELAENIHAGIIETLGAKGTVPAHHELHIGGIGEGGTEESSELLKQTDCLLMIGANWYPDKFVPKETQVIKIDISPGNIEAQSHIAFGLVGDAADIVPLLVQRIPRRPPGEWLEKVRGAKEKMTQRLDRRRQAAGRAIAPQALMAALDESIADDAVIALDTGDHTIWFNRIFRAARQTVLFSGKWRTMGYALPAAISAQLHFPDKQVTVLTGDGSFMTSVMELSTLVQCKTPVKIIIANNASFAAERTKMLAEGKKPCGVQLTNPDFSALARSFGIRSRTIDRAEDLSGALQAMYANEQAMLLDVHITDEPSH